MRDPSTPEEWQEAVDAAELMLAMESAAMYGLIETDIQIDRERCEHILQVGLDLGYQPNPDVIEKAFKS